MKKIAGVLTGVTMFAQAATAGDNTASNDFFKEMPLQSQSGVMLFDTLNEYNFYNGERAELDPKDRTNYGVDFLLTGRAPDKVIGNMSAMTCEHILKENGKAGEETLKAFFHAVEVPMTPDLEKQIETAMEQARDACNPPML